MSANMHSNPGAFQENTLALALERLAAGESPARILAEAGADAEWLEPLLSVASTVHELREAVPIPSAEAGLARFLAQAERIRSEPGPRPTPRRRWGRWLDSVRLPSLSVPRPAAAAFSVVLTLLALTVGTALFLGAPATAAAQNVLPGQLAYPIKRLGEEIYLLLPQSSQSRNVRAAEYEGRRRDEARMLLDRRLEACITFQGNVDRLDTAQTVVDGISFQMTDETQVEGPLAVGAQALVEACSQRSGVLVAEHITVERPAPPTETPSPMPTPQPTSTATATVQLTATATLTPSLMPTPTEMVTEVAAPEPTDTPTREPTEISTSTPTHEPEAAATSIPSPTEETPELPGKGENENNANNDGSGNEGNDNTNDNGGNANDNTSDDGGNINDGGGNDNGGDDHANDNDHSGGDGDVNANDSGGDANQNSSGPSGSGDGDHS